LEISCVVLAGGKSTRLGRDKVLEKIGNKSLLEQVISRTESLSKEIIIVTAKERTFTHLESREKIKIVSDIFPGQGSLGGIYTGLVKSSSFYNLVLAADMPFVNGSLLKYMMGIAEGFDFTVPRIDGLFEPLHAIYSKACISPIETILSQGKKTIIELFNYVKVRFVEAEEIDRFDPHHLSFFNINTPAELEMAKKIGREDTD
jgi:molybdopterin-guanine dinucleotide biosynthesis protein A